MGELVESLDIMEDEDTRTDNKIKAGLRPKLKWFMGRHTFETFPVILFLSHSMVGFLGQLFLRVNRALGEVREPSSSRLQDAMCLRPYTTVSQQSRTADYTPLVIRTRSKRYVVE